MMSAEIFSRYFTPGMAVYVSKHYAEQHHKYLNADTKYIVKECTSYRCTVLLENGKKWMMPLFDCVPAELPLCIKNGNCSSEELATFVAVIRKHGYKNDVLQDQIETMLQEQLDNDF